MSREDRTGWVYLKGANSVVISGLGFGNILVGTGWAVDVLRPSAPTLN